MAQLVLMTRVNPDAPGRYQAGEVVTVVEDSHVFSDTELAHPNWRIIRVTGLPAKRLRELTVAHTQKRRMHHIPLDQPVLSALRGQQILDLSPAAALGLFNGFVNRDG